MPRSDEIPYPPGPDPDDVPDDLTDYPASHRNTEWLLLVCLSAFLVAYLFGVLATGFLTVWLAIQVSTHPFTAVPAAMLTFLAFVYLVRGFFKRPPESDPELRLELTEKDHPDLFAFVRRVCEDTGADEPDRIIALPDSNAGARVRVSLLSLFGGKPRKDLFIGLGLVNAISLSEFKAVVAHEFGHFTQVGFAASYGRIVRGILLDLVDGRDKIDESLDWMKRQSGFVSFVGKALALVLWLPSAALSWVLRLIGKTSWEVDREAEFHADRVAASVAGSDAAVFSLLRSGFAVKTLGFAATELRKAADHKLYTADLYYHQHAAADLVRKIEKDPHLGIPPELPDKFAGRSVQVFEAEAGDDPADVGDYHPSDHEREESLKALFVPAALDTRSPWVLFGNPAELRERMTYKWYRIAVEVPKGTALTDARAVQKFIDDEYAETTYDPRYAGVYDDRFIAPGKPDELNELIRKDPWDDDRILAVHSKLYLDARGRAEERQELLKEYNAVLNQAGGARSKRARKLLARIDDDLEKAGEWFDSLDRRAYLVYVQMAYRVAEPLYFDLVNRYRFHLAIQGMYKSAKFHQEKAHFFADMAFSKDKLHPDDFIELMHVLREARAALKRVVRDARDLDMPAMKNFDEGDRLADFLLDQEIVRELPETFVDTKWVSKLLRQLDRVRSRASRLHFKSLGGLLRLQEDIAVRYRSNRVATAAE